MLTKRKFPNDWSNLTDAKLQQNLKYLQKYYKRYNVTSSDRKSVDIGNVNIHWEIRNSVMYYIVNNKAYPYKTEIGHMLCRLLLGARNSTKTFKEKFENFYDYSGLGELGGEYAKRIALILLFVIGGTICLNKCSAQKHPEQGKNDIAKIENNIVLYKLQNER